MNPENITLSDRSPPCETTSCMSPFTGNVQNKQICRDKNHVSGCQGQEGEERLTGGTRFPPGVTKMFSNYIVLTAAQSCECINNRLMVDVKSVKGMQCELYLNDTV